jgi:hypothetical protein
MSSFGYHGGFSFTFTESTSGFAKLIKGRHATKVANINLSGLFEITITVNYLNLLRF